MSLSRTLFLKSCVSALLAVGVSLSAAASDTVYDAKARVYFSPSGGATKALVSAIDNARQRVLVQAFLFSGSTIAKALIRAHQRGVKVRVVVDTYGATSPKSKAKDVHAAGIETTVDDKHGTAHNKVVIIDSDTVATGSFNFTSKAEKKNAENLLILTSKPLAQRYAEEWLKHRGHSVALEAYLKNPRPQKYGKW